MYVMLFNAQIEFACPHLRVLPSYIKLVYLETFVVLKELYEVCLGREGKTGFSRRLRHQHELHINFIRN